MDEKLSFEDDDGENWMRMRIWSVEIIRKEVETEEEMASTRVLDA